MEEKLGITSFPIEAQNKLRFKWNCTDLEGYIIECSDYKQANKYVSTDNWVSKYVGEEYKQGEGIRSTLETDQRFTIALTTIT